jgi:hypothetical protein
MKTNELHKSHPVALSYGICAEDEIHGDTEHFYEVDIEDERVRHYTPEGVWFDDVDSPAEIVDREPEATYPLTTQTTDDEQTEADNSSTSLTATDGGIADDIGQGDSQQVRCSNCGRRRNVAHTVEAGTTVGNYLGLADSFTTDVCTRCWNRIPEEVTQNDDFGLLEFEGWEREITTGESRFVSATWESGNHIVTLDAVGEGDWTVSWFGENESSEQTDDWHSRYEARQFAIDQIQQMIRLIESGMVSISAGAEGESCAREDSKGSSASSCERCDSTEGTNWVVQAGTPAGRYLGLSDSETTELCDACMREVAESIADEDDNTHDESIQGGENEC